VRTESFGDDRRDLEHDERAPWIVKAAYMITAATTGASSTPSGIRNEAPSSA
jgi:hypothetical protein